MIDEIEITRAGVGTPDDCWIWYEGALHQIHVDDGCHGEIHSLHLKCHKGDWILIPETKRDKVLWSTLSIILLMRTRPSQVVV